MKTKWFKVDTSFAQSCSSHICGALIFRNGVERWGYRLSNGVIAYRQFDKKQEAMRFVEDNDPKLNTESSSPIEEQLSNQHIESAKEIILTVEKECYSAGLRSAQTLKEQYLTTPTNLPLCLLSVVDSIKGKSAGAFRLACRQADVQLRKINSPRVVPLIVQSEQQTA